MTLAAFCLGVAAGALVVAVAAQRRIRHADELALRYLNHWQHAEAHCNRLVAEKRKAEEIPRAVISTYQHQIKALQVDRIRREAFIATLEAAIFHPSNRKDER